MKLLTDLPYDLCSAYIFSEYVVWVFREENEVRLTFQNRTKGEGEAMPYGGSVWMTPDVAKRLGHALTQLSSPDGMVSELERIEIVCHDEEST